MIPPIPVVYENGVFRPLESVNLSGGERGKVILQQPSDDAALRAALRDGVQWPDTSDDSDAYLEAKAKELARAFSSERLMSDLISQERDER